jgi:predicted O-methyltransferase YrrM
MHIKNLIKQIPFAVTIQNKIDMRRRNSFNEAILKQLKGCGCHQAGKILEALISLQPGAGFTQTDRDWKDRIEIERERLLTRHEPLSDGSLGPPVLYDEGVSIEQACRVSKAPKPALLLYLLTRTLKPHSVIELGTNVGISSAYMGAGLHVTSGHASRITTLDASPYRQRLAKEVHRNLGIDNISYVDGLFVDTLPAALAASGPVDFAFIDGHHQYQPTLDYFEEILKFSIPDAVFVFDDIRWSDGMKQAWSRIQSDERLGVIVDLSTIGICTRRQNDNSQRFVSDPLCFLKS